MPRAPKRNGRGPLYIVEHMEEGLEEWCRLEYTHMCEVVPADRLLFLRWPSGQDPATLCAPGASSPRTAAMGLRDLRPAMMGDEGAQAVEDAPAMPSWDRICLLDMDAEDELDPSDVVNFDAFVFGGILGNVHEHEDGTYGSDDRTRELRDLGFVHRRHLGPLQMTTDTAVLACNLAAAHTWISTGQLPTPGNAAGCE